MNLRILPPLKLGTHPIISALDLVTRPRPEGDVSWIWLLRRAAAFDNDFAVMAQVEHEPEADGILQKVTINNQVYFWPAEAPLEILMTFASEQTFENHPHRYLWGKTTVGNDDVLIDIGACEGSFSARAAERGAKVIAVEPSTLMTKAIQRLFAERKLAPPVIANCLLGEKSGELHFLDNPTNPGASRIADTASKGSYPVPVKTLDQLVESLHLGRVDFIKCDAEGSDVGILYSGRETLRRFHPRLAICTYHNDSDYLDLFRYLKEFGYSIKGKGFLRSHGRYRVFMLHAW